MNATQRSGLSVSIQEVSQIFQSNVVALEDLNFSIVAGEFVSILGPSGSGKSTLLRLIAGLDRPTKGSVSVSEGSTAYVFQESHLMPWRTLEENVQLPLELLGKMDKARVDSAILQLGLSDARHRYPHQLSGGMKMRTSLARALVTSPQLLLLDEPFAALDEMTRQKLDEDLRALWERTGMTVIFVTHSISEALFLANRTFVLSAHPGKLILDRKLEIKPGKRDWSVKTSPEFNREMTLHYEAIK